MGICHSDSVSDDEFALFSRHLGMGEFRVNPTYGINSIGELDMKIETRAIGDVSILDCRGNITLGDGTMVVRNAVRETLNDGGKKIILNLADVRYIDSSGVGELVSTYTTVTGHDGQLKLLHLNQKTRALLTMTKLLTVFQVYEDEQEALASFA